MKCIFGSLAAVEYILATKALPGQTTFVTWWRVSTTDRNCCFVAFLLGSHVLKSYLILASLSTESLIYRYSVSNIILTNDNNIDGLSNFSAVRGTSNFAHKDIKMLRFC